VVVVNGGVGARGPRLERGFDSQNSRYRASGVQLTSLARRRRFPRFWGETIDEGWRAVALLHIGQAMPFVGSGCSGLGEHLPALHLPDSSPCRRREPCTRFRSRHPPGSEWRSFGLVRQRAGEGDLSMNSWWALFIHQGEEGRACHHAGHFTRRHCTAKSVLAIGRSHQACCARRCGAWDTKRRA